MTNPDRPPAEPTELAEPTGSSGPADPPTPAAAPGKGRRTALFVIVGALVLAVVGAGVGLYLGNVGPFKDSGLVVCESFRTALVTHSGDLDLGDGPDTTPGVFTEAEYQRLRSRFENSRYGDLRTAGVGLSDILRQTTQRTVVGDPAEYLREGQQQVKTINAFLAACANHGVPITG